MGPDKDIFNTGTLFEIDDIAEEMLSPHCRPLTGLLYEGWFSNVSVQVTELETAQKPDCVCASDPTWWTENVPQIDLPKPGSSKEQPKKDKNKNKVKNNNDEAKVPELSDMSSTGNPENSMDTEVGGPPSVNPDFVLAPQPNEDVGRLNKVFTESELNGIKEYCKTPNLQILWTTKALTEFQSVTLVLSDWLLRGRENKYWGGLAPPESFTWLPQRWRVTESRDLKAYRARLVTLAESRAKSEESRSVHSFWSGVVVPPGIKRIVTKKRDCTVSVQQIGGLVSELANLIQSKRLTLQDPTYRADPLHDDWFRAPIVEFTQRHSLKRASSSKERLNADHQTPSGSNSGAPNVQTDGEGASQPEGDLQKMGKKNKNNFNNRQKGRNNSNDRSSYQRGGRGDSRGNKSQVRHISNDGEARSQGGYGASRNGDQNTQTDNRYRGNPRDADPALTWMCQCYWKNFNFQQFCLRDTCGLRRGSATRARGAHKKRRTC